MGFSQWVNSEAQLITGIETAVAISIVGGEYAIDGVFTDQPGLIHPGQSLMLRVYSGNMSFSEKKTDVSIGQGVTSFLVINREDTTEPTSKIEFPFGNAQTADQQFIVRGTSTDDNGISQVTINGVVAQTNDGFRQWWATVPLSAGMNTFDLVATDLSGNSESQAGISFVDYQSFLSTAAYMDVSTSGDVAFLTDKRQIVKVDLKTGNRSEIASNRLGNGRDFIGLTGILYDESNQRLIVADEYLSISASYDDILMSVDIKTGDRTIISSPEVGAGINFRLPISMSLDLTNNRVLFMDAGIEAVFSVDLTTGDRTVLSGAGVGSGVIINNTGGFVVDLEKSVAYASTSEVRGVIAIDLNDGDRTIVSSPSIGEGTVITAPSSIAFDAVRKYLYVVNNPFAVPKSIVRVDIATGNRVVVAGEGIGTGETFEYIRGLHFDNDNQRLIFSDITLDVIFTIDLATGHKKIVTSSEGSYSFNINGDLIDIERGNRGDRLFVRDYSGNKIHEINPENGQLNTTFSDIQQEDHVASRAFSVNTQDNLLYRAWSHQNLSLPTVIKRFDIAGGVTTNVAVDNVNSNASTEKLSSIKVSADGKSLYAIDLTDNQTLEINILTGERSVLTKPNGHEIFAVNEPSEIYYDIDNHRLILLDAEMPALYSINLFTKELSLISSSAEPSKGLGVPFIMANTLDYDKASDTIHVRDRVDSTSRIISVAADSGDRKVLYDVAVYSDAGVITYSENKMAYYLTMKHLAVIDLLTGQSIKLFPDL